MTVSEHAVQVREPFADVFEQHFALVHGYLRRRVGDVAEDLAAETFERALAGYDRYDPGRGGLRPWLLGIATNLIHDHRRAEARRLKAYAKDAGRTPPPSEGPDVAAMLDASVVAGRAAKAVSRLNPGDRDVLLLFAWADLGYEEIATALDIPVGTVRSRLNRARGAVRDHLEGR